MCRIFIQGDGSANMDIQTPDESKLWDLDGRVKDADDLSWETLLLPAKNQDRSRGKLEIWE